jgi:dipeptidyl aminopeptidase/acylaminoacyl peptidase
VNGVDPLDTLATLDRPLEPREDFAEELLARCLAELESAPVPVARRGRLVVAVAAAVLILAGTATATYLALRASAPSRPVGNAALTVMTSGPPPQGIARIAVVAPGGRLRTIWHCPEPVFCGELTSIAWSRDGKHLAMTLGEIGGRSGYVGLHVVDIATGRDRHLGVPAIPHVDRPQPMTVLERLGAAATRKLGCPLPHELAWAPDGARLAYVCGNDLLSGGAATALYVIGADGANRIRVRTGTKSAYWPTWSPDGTRLAFATGPVPRLAYRFDTNDPVRVQRSSIYVIGLDGSHRTLVAREASAPAWSPDGKTIAYESRCGVRLASPEGDDLTPHTGAACPSFGPRGPVAWSPDGSELAIGTAKAVELERADGTGLHHATGVGAGGYGVGRPAWAPVSAVDALLGRRPQSGL